MQNQFYNDTLVKITYGEPTDLDFSIIRGYKTLIPGEEYVCKTNKNDPKVVVDCFELKSMDFEIRNVKESSTYENTYSCSVRVLSYQQGTEYPKTENVVVVGYFYNAYAEAVYSTKGYWDCGKDGRDVFFITERDQVITSSENSITKYLSSILKGKSIGKATIQKIVSELGCNTLNRIREDEGVLNTIIKSEKKRQTIIEVLTSSIENEKALNYLIQNNIPAETAINIINKLGTTAYSQISVNPYVLLKFTNIQIERINSIAKRNGIPYHCDDNIDGLILRYINYRTTTFGDIYVDRCDFTEKVNGFTQFELFYDRYNQYKKFTTSEINKSISRLIDSKSIFIIKDADNESRLCIYDKFFYKMESNIINKLLEIKNAISGTLVSPSDIQNELSSLANNGIKLDIIQEMAVKQALTNKLSIISGGPGTGKTLVTKIIVNIFQKYYPDKNIQLCAPTGKASRRMSDVIGLPACTIHKKIGYGSDQLLPINEDLLIIDECSMMDIELFSKTLAAISENTSIILVGDYNQLPSVGPGLILRDLIDSNVISHTILKSVFRQSNGSEIINAANAVLDKDISRINEQFGKDFVFIEQVSKKEICENISGSIKYLLNNGVDPSQIQILTPQNDGIIGTTGLNNLMREICNPTNNHNVGALFKNTMFYPGDRIIETENNSELNIFNGSIGNITEITKDEVIADFDGRRVVLANKDMASIKLGYAITVHRSQGSEFDYVFVPIISEHEFTLNKNLVYTAITRAKKMCVLFGEKDVLNNTIMKEIVFDRKSQIKARLKNGLQIQTAT